MPRLITRRTPPRLETKPLSFWDRVKELDMFFQGRDPVHRCLRRVAKKLEKAEIPYAVIGGMAVFAHRHQRTTKDVDLLLTAASLDKFQRLFVPKDYKRLPRRPRRFKDPVNGVTLDIVIAGHFPGTGQPGPIAFPDPVAVGKKIEGVRFVDLPTLIQLKLAAHRYYDFGDVVNLIRVHKLDEAFLTNLHPSLHRDFIECLEEKRREDLYEATSDQALLEQRRTRRYGSETD